MKRKIYLYNLCEIYIISMVILLFLSPLSNISFSAYFDEIVALLGSIALMYGIIHRCFEHDERVMVGLFFLMLFLGVLSNQVNRVVTNISYIVNALYSFSRIFFVFFGTKALLNNKKKRTERVLYALGGLANWFIILAFIFGILNLLEIVDMYNGMRFGIRHFCFYFGNASQLAVFAGSALGLSIFSRRNNIFIEIMGIGVLIMTIKGTAIIIVTSYILLNIFLKYELRWWHILMGAVCLIGMLQFQIQAYILNGNAPRVILIYYGMVTAIRFFPLGSGFATYGSNMAAVHYSPLYVDYNFMQRRALARYSSLEGTGTYLNDVYLGMILGEFGLIGTICLAFIMLRLWKMINSTGTNYIKAKQICIALFVCFCGCMVMLGSVKNAPGEIMLMSIAIYLSSVQRTQIPDNQRTSN